MDPTIVINERVDVIALYRKGGDISALAFPAKMRYNGQDIVFTKLGMRHPTSKGKRMIHVFDVSDGVNDYRLEFDAENLTWTLVAMIGGA
ncbi:TPA: hypothetical protein EYO12_02765 [Candidatus Saccharibacteria bacterium]|nr:hypothetical protein [Candidatus Saccharibacteria bacterium]HIO88039.1 hypothetical protein [Candidatus Saccharibacteria bacterium]